MSNLTHSLDAVDINLLTGWTSELQLILWSWLHLASHQLGLCKIAVFLFFLWCSLFLYFLFWTPNLWGRSVDRQQIFTHARWWPELGGAEKNTEKNVSIGASILAPLALDLCLSLPQLKSWLRPLRAAIITRSSAIAGRPCDAKACQG